MKLSEENKNLLKQYVCMSIPFGLKAQIKLDDEIFIGTIYGVDENSVIYVREGNDYKEDTEFENIKPFLRYKNKNNMTSDEWANYWSYINQGTTDVDTVDEDCTIWFSIFHIKGHFDCMNLIGRNLAIEVTEDNNPYNLMK